MQTLDRFVLTLVGTVFVIGHALATYRRRSPWPWNTSTASNGSLAPSIAEEYRRALAPRRDASHYH